MRALALSCVLAACATGQGSARDDDEQRLARDADRQRAGTSAAATADDSLRDDPAATAPSPAPAPAEKRPTAVKAESSGNMQNAAAAAQANAMAMAQSMNGAKARADAECAPLENRPVGWNEERGMGGALAALKLKAGKGYLDPLPTTDPKALLALNEKSGGHAVLPAGEKNDVTQYVQVLGASLVAGSSRPAIPWVFGVLDDPAKTAVSVMGGYVFVTTGLIGALENEAQLAAMLAHEIAHVAARHPVADYQKATLQMCRIGLTGLYLVEAGAGNMAGGADFVRNAKFAKTMRRLTFPEGIDFDKDPDVDRDYLLWNLSHTFEMQAMTGPAPEVEAEADARAVELLTSAGYDSGALALALARIDKAKFATRIAALDKLRAEGGFGAKGGKTPPWPATLKLPK